MKPPPKFEGEFTSCIVRQARIYDFMDLVPFHYAGRWRWCLACVALGGRSPNSTLAENPKPAMDSVIAAVLVDLQREESFRAKPYPDSRGTTTIGWGTAIGEGITRTEGAYLLRERLVDTRKRLAEAWEPFEGMPAHVQVALLDMGYQLGVEGVVGNPRVTASGVCDRPRAARPPRCGFHDMLAALEREDYAAARAAALDSEWGRETAARARRVADALVK